jgi:hypothetical protein
MIRSGQKERQAGRGQECQVRRFRVERACSWPPHCIIPPTLATTHCTALQCNRATVQRGCRHGQAGQRVSCLCVEFLSVDVTQLFSLRKNAIAKEPGAELI